MVQGEDEEIIYTIDISPYISPTSIVLEVKDDQGADVTRDVTALKMETRARSSNVATIVTLQAHGLTTGNVVSVFNCAGTGYNAEDVSVTVTGPTSFTYANTGTNETATADTAGRVETPASATPTAPTAASIQLPPIHSVEAGEQYRVEVKFRANSQLLEHFGVIIGEE
jgi:hypothetical protein